MLAAAAFWNFVLDHTLSRLSDTASMRSADMGRAGRFAAKALEIDPQLSQT
jgi:hypothetical protein